jgi:hypothetical protein
MLVSSDLNGEWRRQNEHGKESVNSIYEPERAAPPRFFSGDSRDGTRTRSKEA